VSEPVKPTRPASPVERQKSPKMEKKNDCQEKLDKAPNFFTDAGFGQVKDENGAPILINGRKIYFSDPSLLECAKEVDINDIPADLKAFLQPSNKSPIKSTASPQKSPVRSPVKTPQKSPVRSPVKTPQKSPVQSPVKQATPQKSPVRSPVKTPQKSPVRSPVKQATPQKSPVRSPVKTPQKSPVRSPVKTPQKSPVRSPVKQATPQKSPVRSPVRSPVKQATPQKSPVRSPVRSPQKSPSRVQNYEQFRQYLIGAYVKQGIDYDVADIDKIINGFKLMTKNIPANKVNQELFDIYTDEIQNIEDLEYDDLVQEKTAKALLNTENIQNYIQN
jgi:hypothetical protein